MRGYEVILLNRISSQKTCQAKGPPGDPGLLTEVEGKAKKAKIKKAKII